MKNKVFLYISLVFNFIFIALTLTYLFTPYLDSIVGSKSFLDSSKKIELALEKEKSCNNAEHLRWNGLNEANVRPLLLTASIEENMEYYRKNIELIPSGIDAQGGEVAEKDKKNLLNEFLLAQDKAKLIYEEYLQEKSRCEKLTEKYKFKYGEE